MKVYTKKGDRGTTSLRGGERVPKCDLRVEAYGTVDELSAHAALLADMMRGHGGFGAEADGVARVLSDLMYVEAALAAGKDAKPGTGEIPAGAVARLEAEIDRMSAALEPPRGFAIPGGHPIVSQSHVCRTVCRRAERAAAAAGACDYAPQSAAYLNRLSDWLYLVGRTAVKTLGVKEVIWTP